MSNIYQYLAVSSLSIDFEPSASNFLNISVILSCNSAESSLN